MMTAAVMLQSPSPVKMKHGQSYAKVTRQTLDPGLSLLTLTVVHWQSDKLLVEYVGLHSARYGCLSS